ncbi:MAG TPA: 30S ribosomal protein S1 [Nitrospiria bacterium]|nr:30S ribosomal protein S1 [Nitrospiria bacterium]
MKEKEKMKGGSLEKLQALPQAEGEAMDMNMLYEETFKNLEEGTVVEGTVVDIQTDGVLVDIGYKSEGVIPREEFTPAELSQIKVGDRIQIYLDEREDSEGKPVLSKEKAEKMKVWEDLEKSSKKGEVVEGKILSRIKGGMIVDIGVKAFLPGSQIDLRPIRDLDSLVGKSYPMKIIKMNQRRGNIVVSRRVLLEESRDRKRQTTLAALEEGQRVHGVVKNITEYGAFIDLGGIDGLLHITDMSWGRISHPSELFSVGSKVEVTILKYDRETNRVSLGYKQTTADPWSEIEKKHPVGSKVQGKVVSLTDYGAFVELEKGIEGLVHISEMTWTHEIRHPSKIVSVGQTVETLVLHVDKDNRKISLGMKQIEPNPWDLVEKTYPVGSKIQGKIKSLTDFGAFVGLEEGIDGLIHVSDMSWTKRLTHPSELFKKGQPVEAVVLKIDREKERLSLGYKQLTPDPWEKDIPEKYPVGSDVQARVVKITDFGIFVEMEDGVEGLIHVSEAGLEAGTKIDKGAKLNDQLMARVIKMDPAERKIALSIKEYKRSTDQKDVEEFHRSQGPVDQSLGKVAQRSAKKKESHPESDKQ